MKIQELDCIIVITKMNLRNDVYNYIVQYSNGQAIRFTREEAERYILTELDHAYGETRRSNAIWASLQRI